MDKEKQTALERAGWKVSTTREFLDLTEEEHREVERRVRGSKATPEEGEHAPPS